MDDGTGPGVVAHAAGELKREVKGYRLQVATYDDFFFWVLSS